MKWLINLPQSFDVRLGLRENDAPISGLQQFVVSWAAFSTQAIPDGNTSGMCLAHHELVQVFFKYKSDAQLTLLQQQLPISLLQSRKSSYVHVQMDFAPSSSFGYLPEKKAPHLKVSEIKEFH